MSDSNPKDFDQLYPGRFLKAGDTSARPMLTIDRVVLEDLEGEKGMKQTGIVLFREDRRGLVLNKTNGYCLRHMFGRDLSQWSGKRVVLFRDDNVQFGRERVSAIRIYGSPDIPADTEVEIKHPKKKAFRMVLHAAGGTSAAPKAERQTLAQEVEAVRARYTALIRRVGETEAEARKRAVAELGTVNAKSFTLWRENAERLIERAEAPRDETEAGARG